MAVVIVVIVIIVLAIILCYNGLVTERNNVKNAWSQIDVQLQRRFDLIPNLVETVKGYVNHEEKVLTKVTELRTSWAGAKTVNEKAELNNELSSSLKSIMAISEGYPDLKASTNFLQLQSELKNTEDKLSSVREVYNQKVTSYNTKLEVIPTNIIASLFNFKAEELFKVDSPEAKQNVKVSF